MINKMIFLASMALSIALSPTLASAKETKLKATKDQVRSSCNASGGELLGISEFGSYGCDNTENGGGMILCNKNGDCTGHYDLRGAGRSIGGKVKRAAPVVGALARR